MSTYHALGSKCIKGETDHGVGMIGSQIATYHEEAEAPPLEDQFLGEGGFPRGGFGHDCTEANK